MKGEYTPNNKGKAGRQASRRNIKRRPREIHSDIRILAREGGTVVPVRPIYRL